MIMSVSGRLAAVSVLGFLTLTPAGADDPPGIEWEMTSQMVMAGMPFTPRRAPQRRRRRRRVWTSPPPGGDSSCVNSDFQRPSPNKVTWTMQCSGQMPMTGTGEITFADEGSYTGAINATAEGMTMTINLSGKKIGTCENPVQ